MTKHSWLMVALLVLGGCSGTDPNSCKLSCTTDADCPAGLACGELGLCAADGDTCSCTAGAFIACEGDNAIYCNDAANGIRTDACGASSCNADAKRCNACVINTASCSADAATVDHCGADGLVAQQDACAAGCVTEATGPRCANIQPVWLPDVCTDRATTASLDVAGALDAQDDAACTGGVVTVNGTTFCVVRAATITVNTVKVTGTRAIAFVADEKLTVSGTLDVSADGGTSGPGAGSLGAGTATTGASYLGAGGGGFAQVGGTGGGNDTGTVAGNSGGQSTQRLTTARFVGGAPGGGSYCSGTFSCLAVDPYAVVDFDGGGGGGGALLIACRGTVSVTGAIDAGGGGGHGGGDHYTDPNSTSQGGGSGGGSGGYVVLQGVHVEITGKVWANGGGGGSGGVGGNGNGNPGADGLRSTASAAGGPRPSSAQGSTCGGGIGGSISSAPGIGEQTFTTNGGAGAGGGGGAMGRFEIFTSTSDNPTVTPTQASPVPVVNTMRLSVH